MFCPLESFWRFIFKQRFLLAEISLLGMKYLDKQIENAISGVKEMKTVMERSGEDHEKFLSALEKTTQQKEVQCI
jgi:clusterin